MSYFHVFPKFREFVVLFGEKTGENEIGPPHFKFHFLPQSLTVKTAKAFGTSSCLPSLIPIGPSKQLMTHKNVPMR
jgi:hypothetical protein